MTISFLRRGVKTKFLNQLWQQARDNDAAQKFGPRSCPSCSQKMPTAVFQQEGENVLVLDVCASCHFVWLDPGEAADMPLRDPQESKSQPELSPEAKRAVAMAKVELIGERMRREDPDADITGSNVGSFFRWLFRGWRHW